MAIINGCREQNMYSQPSFITFFLQILKTEVSVRNEFENQTGKRMKVILCHQLNSEEILNC